MSRAQIPDGLARQDFSYLGKGIMTVHDSTDVAQYLDDADANHGYPKANKAPREGQLGAWSSSMIKRIRPERHC